MSSEEINLIVGIGGALVGAIVGAFGSYWGSKKIMKQQFLKEERKINIEQENKRNLLIRVISTILKQEIINNQDVIKPSHMCESIKEKLEIIKMNGVPQQYKVGDSTNMIKVNMYEEMKWELMKYSDDPLILDIIELYNDFYSIKRGFDIYNMKVKEIEKISTLEERIIELLDKLI